MFTQARYFIRTALVCLLAAFIVGAALLINQGLALGSWVGVLLPTFYHLLMVGWVTQLICGVALWMFPVLAPEQPRGPPWMGWTIQLASGVAFWILPRLDTSGSRGDERLIWWHYAALNAGVAFAALHDPLVALVGRDGPLLRGMPALAGLLYLVAAILFVRHAWPRIVPFRALPRRDRA